MTETVEEVTEKLNDAKDEQREFVRFERPNGTEVAFRASEAESVQGLPDE